MSHRSIKRSKATDQGDWGEEAALEREVRKRTGKLQEVALALISAEEAERRKLAQDLHDDLTQVLSVAQIKLRAYVKARGTEGDDALSEIARLLEQANRAARSLAFQISPAILYQLGLVAALDWLGDELGQRLGLRVSLHADNTLPALDERVGASLFRAVRELLTSVVRHAGVYSAEVHVSVKDAVIGTDHQHLLVIEVTDCGAGFSAQVITGHPGTGGLGLVGVPERLKLIDGGVEVASVPGLGTRVTLTVPLMAPATPSAGELA